MAPMPSYLGETVDVCIVGSGAGGGPVARELARAGARVVALEKGPWYTKADFHHDEISTVRRTMWVPSKYDEPHMLHLAGEARASRSEWGWIASCVGGGTVHMGAFMFRLQPIDFRMRSEYGAVDGAALADWPIDYETLAPYYDQAERFLGVSGDVSRNPHEPPRNGPLPLPPLAENPLTALVERGANSLGRSLYTVARAILSRAYQGRPVCSYCQLCGSYGCENDSKSSSLVTWIADAVATERCEVRPRSMVHELVVDAQGRVGAARYRDASGQAQEQKARVFVVAASAVESARLLLNSKSGRFSRGLANGSGLVGEHLMFSTLGSAYAEFERATLPDVLRPANPIQFLNRATQDFYRLGGNVANSFDKAGTILFLLPHRNPIFTADRIARRSSPPLWGMPFKEALERYYKELHTIELEVFGEFLPSSGTRVTVDGAVRDKWGVPSATIHLAPHSAALRNTADATERGLDVLRAAGASAAVADPPSTTYVLQHGGCRFGRDPSESVLNPDCRAHEVENLYVTDGSFMPTSGGVPTTLTITANALRVAAKIREALQA